MSATVSSVELSRLRAVACSAARKTGLDVARSEDVAQRALLALFEARQPIESKAAWIYTVARRASFRALSKERRMRLQELGDEASNAPSFEDRVDLQRLIGRLSPASRDVLFHRAMEGCSVPEVVERTGLSPSTIKRRMARARCVFERALAL